ncbi:Tah11p NDAI_0G04740 [Naumovozyma dairenensis CBS 421]|uniref:DNA replication factor Cdt1 C-terminal domain-containing protein n=1 Tax=Naumovozyma dairenensis (strain ATCC 10597 / BCRC 20456 / CBS 421 / NBRC 0211 / NRRL Y-12639) TaxID=1071378 RepID=J7SB10_NAUDC|nr:hypothetical protein NDAI_0G04740 [Naumovozyma dairenensis CBS 421]CCK73458.1 hypothetical protein NDAI_0G04740 [Naumovozyma dairenensis CBS 421]
MSTQNTRKQTIPIIDLDKISQEDELLPVVRSILLYTDTFLLKNYANKSSLDSLISHLNDSNNAPDTKQQFDANFTGTLSINNDISMEQYIYNSEPDLQFNRTVNNPYLQKLSSRLFKVSLFFSQLCLKSIVQNTTLQNTLSETNFATKLTRYHHERGNLEKVSVNGEDFQYLFNHDFINHTSAGILTVFPIAKGIKYKPPTASIDDNQWTSIDEPDCLLFHTGTLLSTLSNGLHSTSPIQIDPSTNPIHLTIFPPLSTPLNGNKKVSAELLSQQIKEFPQVAEKFYNKQSHQLILQQKLNLYKRLFTTSETILSLNSMSRVSNIAPELHSLLPQMSNMMNFKIVQDDFLKLLTIWPQAYIIEANSKCELAIKLPQIDPLMALSNKSRKLQFAEMCDLWYLNHYDLDVVPKDVPPLKVNKRRGSIDNDNMDVSSPSYQTKRIQSPTKQKNYIHNKKEQFIYKEKQHDSQSNLLDRLRERERRSAALLSERQRKYQEFLSVKMSQVFKILISLNWNEPYTVTHLTELIADSLQNSNNPIGEYEAEEIIDKLQSLLSDQISCIVVEGGLKVYKWDQLKSDKFESALNEFKEKAHETNIHMDV